MKIIAGLHRGRKIEVIVDKNLRPTRPIVREAVFSILSSGEFLSDQGRSFVESAVVLDLFSGSGSFSMEALSRGAAQVILIDKERSHIELAKHNIESIKETDKATFICVDINRLLPAKEAVDLVFIDPPYKQNLVADSIIKLQHNGWLKKDTLIIAEVGIRDAENIPEGFLLLFKREYGNTKLLLFRAKS
jgi:16S rRNA (guanine966-N2)-methyltransferase